LCFLRQEDGSQTRGGNNVSLFPSLHRLGISASKRDVSLSFNKVAGHDGRSERRGKIYQELFELTNEAFQLTGQLPARFSCTLRPPRLRSVVLSQQPVDDPSMIFLRRARNHHFCAQIMWSGVALAVHREVCDPHQDLPKQSGSGGNCMI
jgi:hypothetical protein